MNEEEFNSRSKVTETDELEIISGEENNEEYDSIDPDYISYLQTSFQDKVVEDLFEDIVSYIKWTGIPMCEYLTREDIEIIIQDLGDLN